MENFYFHSGVFDYDFGPGHPLKPERLHRFFALMDHYTGLTPTNSELASEADLRRVHSDAYVRAVQQIGEYVQRGEVHTDEALELRAEHGFFGDNPPFVGMYEASLAYTGASIDAAKAVRDGAQLAFGIGGGLHHAVRDKASGFCIFNDCAVACSILRDRYERVAYVDIDVHQGDGVQWIFYEDPTILTCSIHEDPSTLWPGTGGVEETGAAFTSFNVPMQAGTTADVWINAFRQTILPALQAWKPGAIVLQMGTDTHYKDPLAHINSNQQAWLEAVLDIQALSLPMVALGGGGYDMTTVPRMWASACLSLVGVPFEDEIPQELQSRVGAATFSDRVYPFEAGGGLRQAERVIESLKANVGELGK